jgi:hypothetical protein
LISKIRGVPFEIKDKKFLLLKEKIIIRATWSGGGRGATFGSRAAGC